MEESYKVVEGSGMAFMTFESPKTYVIDYSKVKTIKDIVEIIKAFNITINEYPGSTQFQSLHDKGFLIEKV